MSNFKKIAVTLGAIGLLVAASGCDIPFLTKTPEQVLRAMYAKLAVLQTVDYKTVDTVQGRIPDLSDIVAASATNTAPKSSGAGKIKFTAEGQTETFYFTPQPDMTMNAELLMKINEEQGKLTFDSIVEGDKAYVKFKEIVGSLGLASGANITAILNQWWSFPREQWEEYTTPEQADLSDEADQLDELTLEQEKQIADLIRNTKFFVVNEPDGFKIEDLDGKKVYHLSGRLDAKAAEQFFVEYYKIIGYPLNDDELADLRATLNNLAAFATDLYVGKSDSQLYRFKAEGDFKSAGTGDIYKVTIQLDLANHNKPVKIQAPADSKPFTYDELMKIIDLSGYPSLESIQKNLQQFYGSPTTQSGMEDINQGVDELEKAAAEAGATGLQKGLKVLQDSLK